MAAVSESFEFGKSTSAPGKLPRGAGYFVSLAVYVGVVILLLGWPLSWLLHTPSLEATLTVSAAAVLALLLLWRAWPAFALVFIWEGAWAEKASPLKAIWRSCGYAQLLTGEREWYFSHGLPVSLTMLVLAQGALSLAGLGSQSPTELRLAAVTGYGVLMLLGNWLVAERTSRVLLQTQYPTSSDRIGATSGSPAARSQLLPMAPSELNTALLNAVRAGNVELALAALQQGAEPNTLPEPSDRDQRSTLVLAALMPEVRLLRALITRRADVNQCHQGLTPLLAATRDSHAGRPDAVLTLLANGADTNTADFEGNTSLHHAARAADATIAAMLLDAGASLTTTNREGHTPLAIAAATANWTLLRFFLERGAKPDAHNSVPALLAAASIAEDDTIGVKTLLKYKAKPDAAGPLGRRALMVACLHGHRSIAKALLDAGADANLADAHGTTALMEAARAGATELVQLFSGRKSDVDLRDGAGRSALVIACQSRQARPDTVKALLLLGADPALPARDGRGALDFAVQSGRWDIVTTIDPTYPVPEQALDHRHAEPMAGADSPAHLLDALRFGHHDIAEKFREKIRSWTALDRAEILHALSEWDQHDARAWLLAHGADPDARLGDGERVLDAWLHRLPHAANACRQLLDAGAAVGGSGVARRILEVAREAPAHYSALLQLAQEWLERGGDPFGPNSQGETLLHLATQLGARHMVQWLLKHGSDPNSRDQKGRAPLHMALSLPGDEATALVSILLRHGADARAATANGETPLGLALSRGEPQLLRWMQWRGWNLPSRTLRDTDLPAAALAGDSDAVDKLLQLGLSVDAVDGQGASALLRACGLGHTDVALRLIEAGANIEFAAPTGATCLSAAVSARRDEIVSLLLRYGIDVNHRLPGGGTALMIAAALGFPEQVEQLLNAGAKADLADEKGITALHAAAQFAFQHAESARARGVLAALCGQRHEPNPRNAKGQTPLLLMLGARSDPGTPCEAGYLASLLPLLLDYGADIDAQDERGVSPLHACAMHGLLAPAQQLLARGASRNLRDCLGRSAGDLAHLLGYSELAQQLGGATPMPSLAQMLRQPARPEK